MTFKSVQVNDYLFKSLYDHHHYVTPQHFNHHQERLQTKFRYMGFYSQRL